MAPDVNQDNHFFIDFIIPNDAILKNPIDAFSIKKLIRLTIWLCYPKKSCFFRLKRTSRLSLCDPPYAALIHRECR